MATTTNYSWTTPDDTALVKDGAAAIRSLGTAIDTTVFTNAGAAIAKSIVDAKGDLIVGTADNTVARLAVGANDTILVADSSTASGLKWAAPAGGGKVLQVVNATYDTEVASSTSTYADTGLTATITPSSATSKVLILVTQNGFAKSSSDASIKTRLMRGSTELYQFEASAAYTGGNVPNYVGGSATNYLDSPATTSATTYKTQFARAAGTGAVYLQVDGAVGTNSTSTITLMEIGA